MKRILFYLLTIFSISAKINFGQYEIIELEPGIYINDINNSFGAVGTVNNAAIYWKDGITKYLDLPPSTLSSNAKAINDDGIIVGDVYIEGAENSVFAKWDTSGALIFTATSTSYSSYGVDINNSNFSVGSYRACDQCLIVPAIWSPANSPSIIVNSKGSALGINESNWVVGTLQTVSNGSVPFVWKGTGQPIILPTPLNADSSTVAWDLNDNGYVVGYYYDGPGFSKAVYWVNEQMFIPPVPAGYDGSNLSDINSDNLIVGTLLSSTTTWKGFIFQNGEVTLIDELISPLSGWTITQAIAINDNGVIAAYGYKDGIYKICILVPAFVKQPSEYEKWIAGEKDTITWVETGWVTLNIKCILNFDTPSEQALTIEDGILLDSAYYVWEIPDTILSYQSKIIIENAADPNEKIESDIFRIKPYVLTRLNTDSTYYEYRKDRDQWGFSNTQNDMWPPTWWAQFNYQGIDPFTGSQYSQWQGGGTFKNKNNSKHSDWVSWVNTFLEGNCYFSTTLNLYVQSAVVRWGSVGGNWRGSCFGIAAANALAFAHKEQFQNKYPNYPAFVNPISVTSDDAVKKTVNELFSYQNGNPHKTYRSNIGLNKTPKETLIELVEMFKEDRAQIRTLSFNHNNGSGGHAILAYGLEKDAVNPSLFHIKVYDNSNPNSNNRITIDTSANGNNGSWVNPDWLGWGGNKWFYLRNATVEYLVNPTMAKGIAQQSPFILDGSELEVFNTITASIKIQDNIGNTTGFYNNLIQTNIPGSNPFVVDNGSETPPYGYTLTTDNYSVVLNEFENDTVDVFFFTGNKSFSYERYGAIQSQTDRLFFDGGVSAVNPNAETKTIKLLNIINETMQEKLFVVRSLELAQNDSVKIENPDSNKVKLISYGTAKSYDVEINYVTENGIGRFGDFSVPLTENTSHTFIPEWTDLTNTELQVLVDIGNDGTIDDTLTLFNQVTGLQNQGSLQPNEFRLEQNYPNPFNPNTKIKYTIPNVSQSGVEGSRVQLKVYDVLGNEVATLVNESKPAGTYEIEFNASNLSSGVYFYKLQAGSFVETRKMILLK